MKELPVCFKYTYIIAYRLNLFLFVHLERFVLDAAIDWVRKK